MIEPWATKTAIEANSPQGDRPVRQLMPSTLARNIVPPSMRRWPQATHPRMSRLTIVAAAQDTRAPPSLSFWRKAARQTSFARRYLPRGLFDRSLRKQFNIA